MKPTKKEEKTKDISPKPYNIVVPFNIPGKPDIGLLDLNKIFQVNFNYNFDSLKILLEGLITSYKKTEEELENLKAYNKAKDMKIKDLEQRMLDLNILINNSLGNAEEVEKLKELKEQLSQEAEQMVINTNTKVEQVVEDNKDTKPVIFEKPLKKQIVIKSSKKRKKIHAPINKDVKIDIQIGNDDLVNKIIKKVNGSENTINDLYEAVPLIQKEQDNNMDIFNNIENELYEIQKKIFSIYEENDNIKKKFEENEEKFKDIDIKMQDFNIIDMLKGSGGEGGDTNVTLGLISNLEKKVNAKIKLLEEKISKIDSSSFKVEKEAQNIKNSQNLNQRQIDQIKKQIEDFYNKFENINKNIEQNNEDINDKLDSKTTYLEKYIQDSMNSLNNSLLKKFDTIQETINTDKGQNNNLINSEEMQNMNLENSQALKSLKEAIIEINKKIKGILTQNDFEQMKSDISALKSGMSNYVLIPDFKELRDLSEENKTNIRKIREEFEDWQSMQTENSEIINIKRKLESVSNQVHDIVENVVNKKEKNTYKMSEDDKYKFLDFKIFEEFKSHIAKEFNNINDNFINSRKLLDELIDSVRNRTSFKDLKALEDALMSKMEDLKIAFAKKFAEKNEVNRGMKYLDQQIRNIIQIYIKKIEKGDNWLLSKKPISSNLCASCESYIGDIKDMNNANNIYVPWNKYPVKDTNDKLYRMGNGYSKMLQMIQVDENEKKKEQGNNINNMTKTEYFNGFDVDDFSQKKMKTISSMNKTMQKSLPKLKRKKMKKKINNTDTDNNNINLNDESDDPEEDPKITKIFRINKDNSNK